MRTAALLTHLRLRFDEWRRLAATPPPSLEVFLRRIRFVERGVGLPVKAAVLVFLLIALFFTQWFQCFLRSMRMCRFILRTFFLMYFARTSGRGSSCGEWDEVSARLVVRVTYIMAVLDAAMLGLLTMVMGEFDSILYWIFPWRLLSGTPPSSRTPTSRFRSI